MSRWSLVFGRWLKQHRLNIQDRPSAKAEGWGAWVLLVVHVMKVCVETQGLSTRAYAFARDDDGV